MSTFHDTVIKDGNGDIHFPRTDAESVRSGDGTVTVEQRLDEHDTQIGSINTSLNNVMETITTLFSGTVTSTNTAYTLSDSIMNYKFILIKFKLSTTTEASCLYPSALLKNDTTPHRVVAEAGNFSSFYYASDTSLNLWGTMTTATVFGIN